MKMDRRLAWIVAGGSATLLAGTFAPLIRTRGSDQCGWTCYSPLGADASHDRAVTATDLWHLRPLLAVALIVAALAALTTLLTGRYRRITAVATGVVTVAFAVDAATVDGVDWLLTDGALYRVRPSAWTLAVVLGGLATSLALLAQGPARGRRRYRRPLDRDSG